MGGKEKWQEAVNEQRSCVNLLKTVYHLDEFPYVLGFLTLVKFSISIEDVQVAYELPTFILALGWLQL